MRKVRGNVGNFNFVVGLPIFLFGSLVSSLIFN